jgi:hypothetical protein
MKRLRDMRKLSEVEAPSIEGVIIILIFLIGLAIFL